MSESPRRVIAIPLGLFACPAFTDHEKRIIEDILFLSNRQYASTKGCFKSNEKLAFRHRVSERTVSRAITKANELGFVYYRNDVCQNTGSGSVVQYRHLQMKVPPEWELIGELYEHAFFETEHPESEAAREIIEAIEEAHKANPDMGREEFKSMIDSHYETLSRGGSQGWLSPPDSDRGGSQGWLGGIVTAGVHTYQGNTLPIQEHSSSVKVVSEKLLSDEDGSVGNNPTIDEKDTIAQTQTKSTIRKSLDMKHKDVLDPLTIEVIEFWNKQPNLRTHKLALVGKRNPTYPLAEQTVTVREANELIIEVISGRFYKSRTEVTEKAIRKAQFSFGQIKQAITRLNLSANTEYNELAQKIQNISVSQFFYNKHASFKPDQPQSSKYKYRIPFLHHVLNKPQKIANRPFPAKTDYKGVVTRVIEELSANGSFSGTERDRNEVVRHVNVAVDKIKEAANGASGEILKDLGKHIVECMRSSGGVKFDSLFRTVNYKLIPYLRERRYL